MIQMVKNGKEMQPVIRKNSVQPPNLWFRLVARLDAKSRSEGKILDSECPRTVGSAGLATLLPQA